MKTDSIFYRIFQTDPGILFELLGQASDRAQGYEFKSVEIKQVAFRISEQELILHQYQSRARDF